MMENGRHYVSVSPTLPPFPEGAQSEEAEDSIGSDDTTEIDDSTATEDVFIEGSFKTPNLLPSLNINEEDPDGIPDQMVEQIDLFFSSRFCHVHVSQCHATVTSDDLEKPEKGVLFLQSFSDKQLPTQVQSVKLLLCMHKTFHVLWSKPLFVNGAKATALKEDGDTLVLGPETRIQFRGTVPRRERFINDIRNALQKLRIHVFQDKSARKKAIKAYKKERKAKGKVTKSNISIPCEFAHVTQLTHKHLTQGQAAPAHGANSAAPDPAAYSKGPIFA